MSEEAPERPDDLSLAEAGTVRCPRCGAFSGDDWTACKAVKDSLPCPMRSSERRYDILWRSLLLKDVKTVLVESRSPFGARAAEPDTLFEHALADFLTMLDIELDRLEEAKREAGGGT